ncbi:MAG: hypothetical protein QNK37_17580 [Acidobacteriota bacterium]|nr:hypothetical protein [Acidobacteriota bacterium]
MSFIPVSRYLVLTTLFSFCMLLSSSDEGQSAAAFQQADQAGLIDTRFNGEDPPSDDWSKNGADDCLGTSFGCSMQMSFRFIDGDGD